MILFSNDWPIGIMVRVFPCDPGDQGSSPLESYQKNLVLQAGKDLWGHPLEAKMS